MGDVNSNSVSRSDIIRYIDEESEDSDGRRSFTPSPSRQRSQHFYCHSRARSKSVGQLYSMDPVTGGPAAGPQTTTTHHLHQLTSIEAFLAFRRSLSLKDCKKVFLFMFSFLLLILSLLYESNKTFHKNQTVNFYKKKTFNKKQMTNL